MFAKPASAVRFRRIRPGRVAGFVAGITVEQPVSSFRRRFRRIRPGRVAGITVEQPVSSLRRRFRLRATGSVAGGAAWRSGSRKR